MAGAGYRTFVAAEVLTAAQVNTFLMEQSVMKFTAATGTGGRDTVITSPSAGMVVYMDTGDSSEGLYTYNGAEWRLPWNLPWGYVASTVTPPTSNQTISTTTSTKITGTDTESCSLFANRRYRATCVASYEKTTAQNFTYLQPRTSSGAALSAAWTYNMSIGERELVVWVATFTGTTFTGTLQLNAQVLSAGLEIVNTGTGARLLVEDIGPSGAPV